MNTSSPGPNRIKKQLYVDAAVIQRRLFILPEKIFSVFQNIEEVSPEGFGIIVVVGNEPLNKAEVSQNSEGLNIKLFQMLHGVLVQPCIKRNRENKRSKDD